MTKSERNATKRPQFATRLSKSAQKPKDINLAGTYIHKIGKMVENRNEDGFFGNSSCQTQNQQCLYHVHHAIKLNQELQQIRGEEGHVSKDIIGN